MLIDVVDAVVCIGGAAVPLSPLLEVLVAIRYSVMSECTIAVAAGYGQQ